MCKMAALETYQAQHARALPACTAAAEEANDEHQRSDGDQRDDGRFDDRHILVNADHIQVSADVRIDFDPDADTKDCDACHLVDARRNTLFHRIKHR